MGENVFVKTSVGITIYRHGQGMWSAYRGLVVKDLC
jgi:hypothetical protein